MNALLIIGTKDSGKSTTIKEICTNLKPDKIWRLNFKSKQLVESSIQEIFNDIFIVEKNNKLILVLAGCPTEMNRSFTNIYEICLELKLKLSFAIVAKRTREVKKGFKTKNEIEKFGFEIFEEKINRINNSDFKQTKEWKSRIEKLSNIVMEKVQ